MTLDKDVAVIEPCKGKREKALPQVGILAFTPQDLELFVGCLPRVPKRSHKLFLTDVYTADCQDTTVAIAGPMLGAPQAILVLEKLVALGVRQVVAIGWCGSLQSHVAIGDIVLPVAARSEEGTSGHYPLAIQAPGPALELLSPLRDEFKKYLLRVHEGEVWTTDAPYRETVGKVLHYQRQGVLAVDMEVSALFAVAHYRQIRLATVLIVSDELASLKWIHGFRQAKFQENREKLAALTLNVMCSASEFL